MGLVVKLKRTDTGATYYLKAEKVTQGYTKPISYVSLFGGKSYPFDFGRVMYSWIITGTADDETDGSDIASRRELLLMAFAWYDVETTLYLNPANYMVGKIKQLDLELDAPNNWYTFRLQFVGDAPTYA